MSLSEPAEQTRRPSRRAVTALLCQLVSIDSVNPSLVPGAAGEAAIANFVGTWLGERGLDVTVSDVAPGRPNVIAHLARGGRRTLMLNAHIDTVGVVGMENPFLPQVQGNKLYGRGAYDMKGGLAAVMLAAEMLARSGMDGIDLIVAAVADEEYASLGTEAVIRESTAHGAIVTEPTGLRLCTAHKGFAWLAIETIGKAAHGSKPDEGVDAIGHMGRVLGGIEQLSAQLTARSPHALLGNGSIHASLITGGQELSSYPETCRLDVERRTVPGDTADTVVMEIEGLLSALKRDDVGFQGQCELTFCRDPFEVPLDEDIVRCLQQSAAAVLGKDPEIYGDSPWMDAALLSAAGIPTVVFGPGGAGAHAMEEYVFIDDVAACAEVLARSAGAFCSGGS